MLKVALAGSMIGFVRSHFLLSHRGAAAWLRCDAQSLFGGFRMAGASPAPEALGIVCVSNSGPYRILQRPQALRERGVPRGLPHGSART